MPVTTLLAEPNIREAAAKMGVGFYDAQRLLILAMWDNVKAAMPWLGAELAEAVEQFLLRLETREGIELTAPELAQWSRELPDRWPLGIVRKPVVISQGEINRVCATLAALPQRKRREAARRYLIVRAWELAMEGGAYLGFRWGQVTSRFIAELERRHGIPMSRGTLFNWRRALCRASGDAAGLVDRRGRGRAKKSKAGKAA